jgi:hypothetical protein
VATAAGDVASRDAVLVDLAGDVDDVAARVAVVALLVVELGVVVVAAFAGARVAQLLVAGAAAADGDEVDVAGCLGRSLALAVAAVVPAFEVATEHGRGTGDDAEVALEDREHDDEADGVCGRLAVRGGDLPLDGERDKLHVQKRFVGVV